MRKIIRKFDSVFQFTEYLNHGEVSKLWRGRSLDSKEGDMEFTGTASYEEAQQLLCYGDRRSLELIKRSTTTARLNGTGDFTRRTTRLSAVGYMPHIGAYLAGSPRCMIQRTKETRNSNKVINALYNCATPWNTPKSKIIEQGAKVLAFVNEAERKGYRVNLYASMFSKTKQGDEKIAVLLRIKAAEQMLDLLKTVYPIVNSSFLRRHCFRCLEIDTELTAREWANGYGYSVRNWKDVADILEGSRIKVDYYWSVDEMVEVKA